MMYRIKIAKGFTLMELMIVVAIMAILTAIGAPSYARYIRKAESMKVARGFESALDVALVNAKTSGRPVKVCATNDIQGATPACLATEAAFANFQQTGSDTLGWIVFWDLDNNNQVSAAAGINPAEKIYKRVPYAARKVEMSWSRPGAPVITIQPRNVTGQTGTMCIYAPHGSHKIPSTACDASTDKLDRAVNEVKIRLSALGKVTFIKS